MIGPRNNGVWTAKRENQGREGRRNAAAAAAPVDARGSGEEVRQLPVATLSQATRDHCEGVHRCRRHLYL